MSKNKISKVLVTGANGFIGKNLCLRLQEIGLSVVEFTRQQGSEELNALLKDVGYVFHLAGVNRPDSEEEFLLGNVCLTDKLITAIEKQNRSVPVVFSSSIQVENESPYGKSKLTAEHRLIEFSKKNKNPVFIFRLPNVFGKWCRPNYNSVVATFCNNILNDLPITISDPENVLSLVYIDDVVREFIHLLSVETESEGCFKCCEVSPVYKESLGEIVAKLRIYRLSRESLDVNEVGQGFERALYATYLSYMRPDQFSYTVPMYQDERGVFSELIRTKMSGQFSFFTASPGATRGSHYHHTKNEKFAVVKGRARFGFRNMITQEIFYKEVSGESVEIVETIPGWAHDISNIGSDDLIVLLWANEKFDREQPDTVSSEV